MDDLVFDDPDASWDVILLILTLAPDDWARANLAAGPLEDLLVRHGDRFIDRVEQQARRDPAFAALLPGVWKNAMTDAVWDRVQRLRRRHEN